MQPNLHLTPSVFDHQSRMLKETKSLADNAVFSPIHIAAMWREGLPERERIDDTRDVWRVKLTTQKLPNGLIWRAVKFLEWYARIFWGYRKSGIEVVNCHTLSMLPLGMAFKWFRGCKIVYDTHELETETQAGSLQRHLGKLFERWLIHKTDLITVVSQTIGTWYETEYGLDKIPVIRNIPNARSIPVEPSTVLKDYCGVGDDEILFIYQGALEAGRNVNVLLDVFTRANPNKHIVFLGFGPLEEKIKIFANKHSNIHFHPGVSPDKLLALTSSADVGIHIIGNTCLNHYYCLPNKAFEYLLSGLPSILSDFPELSNLIEESGAGWTTPVTGEDVLKLINSITRKQVEQRRKAALKARENYSWEREEIVLIEAYQAVFAKNRVK